MDTHPALGLDYGTSRIGVAATDDCGILAHPVESIEVDRIEPVARVVQLARQRRIRTLVLGLPLRLDGTEGSACARVRAFGEKLQAALPELPLVYVDEFLTTADAQEKLHAAGRRAHQFRAVIDQAAAVEILNRWMAELTPVSDHVKDCDEKLRT